MTTGISWADETVNPIRARNMETGAMGWHCEHVSEACRNCYAERTNVQTIMGRVGTRRPYEPTELNSGRVEVFLDESVLRRVLGWKRGQAVFWCSMTDLWGRFVRPEWRKECFQTMADSPHHRHVLLTKRIREAYEELAAWKARADAYYAEHAGIMDEPAMQVQKAFTAPPLPNVWIGTTVENQAAADERLPWLLKIATLGWPVWVSYEPALGPVEWGPWLAGKFDRCPEESEPLAEGEEDDRCRGCDGSGRGDCQAVVHRISGIVCGGESGKGARPMHPDWPRQLRDACEAAGVPFHFKQWGEWRHDYYGDTGDGNRERLVESGTPGRKVNMVRTGTKANGRAMAGVTHDALAWGAPRPKPVKGTGAI